MGTSPDSSSSSSPRSKPQAGAGNRQQGGAGGYSRSAHRSRSHNAAHGGAGVTDTVDAAPHPQVPIGPAPLLTDNDQLAELIDHLRSVGSFAYDSEFIGELTYVPKLCVLQVASSQRVALIDPLADVDLTPFWELLCDPAVEKVVHAGQQDIEPVVRHLGRSPANVFDTQVVAGFVSLPYPVSLSKLVQELTGARLGKGLTFTHWDQRPLSPSQLKYAADDVRYLPRVRAELGKRLEEAGHTPWAMEECAAQCDPSLYRFDPETQYLRVRGAGSLQPRNMAVLRELTIWRDNAARAHDLPPRSFLRDEVLVDLARSPAKSVDGLARVRGLPRPVEHQHGSDIVAATQRALSLPAPQLPEVRDTELSPSARFRSDALWVAAQSLCAGRQIDPPIVASRQDLSDFYRAVSREEDLSELRIMKGWRRQLLGEPLLQLYRGDISAALQWNAHALRAELRGPE